MILLQLDIEICTTMLVQQANHALTFHGLSKDTTAYVSWQVEPFVY